MLKHSVAYNTVFKVCFEGQNGWFVNLHSFCKFAEPLKSPRIYCGFYSEVYGLGCFPGRLSVPFLVQTEPYGSKRGT